MKINEIGPKGGRASWCPRLLDPPMVTNKDQKTVSEPYEFLMSIKITF